MTEPIDRIRIPHNLVLLEHQEEIIAARLTGARNRIAMVHRQGGKDITALVDVASAAFHEPGVYGYVMPTYSMARRILWDGVRASDGLPYLSVIPDPLILDRNEAELALTMQTQQAGKVSRIHLLSGDRSDRLRGLPLKGCVVSEYAQFEGTQALDIVKPALVASGGWLLIITTPLGIGNHFHALWQMAQASPDWWARKWTIEQTRYRDGRPMIPQAAIDAELRSGQRLEWVRQEYHCEFSVGLVSSIYGDLLSHAERDHRIGDVPHRTGQPVTVALDLGIEDLTVAIYAQQIGDMVHLIDVDEFQGLALPEIISRIRAHGYNIRTWIAPHDIEHRELTASGAGGQAVTRKAVAAKLGVHFKVAPKVSVQDGIDCVRRWFNRFRFNAPKDGKLLEALSGYRRSWDPERKVFVQTPKHDVSSHYCDALRYLCLALREDPDDDGRERQRYITGRDGLAVARDLYGRPRDSTPSRWRS